MNSMLDKTNIKNFEIQNLPLIVDVVAPLWCPPIGTEEFKRFNVEYIVRNNIAQNDYRFELIDETNGEILAAAFFARKGDKTIADEWFNKESKRFPKDFLVASGMSKTYLELMDNRTLEMMNKDDIKLSLFASRKPGAGSTILSKLFTRLKEEGWKKLYLWTDCDCNWQWYKKHGFDLVLEDTYEPFSSENEDYKVYIYRKNLLSDAKG